MTEQKISERVSDETVALYVDRPTMYVAGDVVANIAQALLDARARIAELETVVEAARELRECFRSRAHEGFAAQRYDNLCNALDALPTHTEGGEGT